MRSCPFCGSENIKINEAVVSMRIGKFIFKCQCSNCFASGPTTEAGEAEAINLWNERKKNKFIDNENTPDLFYKEVINA